MQIRHLTRSVALGQLLLLIGSLAVPAMQWFKGGVIFSATETHMWIQFILSVVLVYSANRYDKTTKRSSQMRKHARNSKEIKSKRIELLIFSILVSLIFYCLFYTVPMNKYIPSTVEWAIYIINSLLQLIVLTRLMSSHEDAGLGFVKSRQKFAGAGALAGLACFAFYYVTLN